jgi:hypothetical protein
MRGCARGFAGPSSSRLCAVLEPPRTRVLRSPPFVRSSTCAHPTAARSLPIGQVQESTVRQVPATVLAVPGRRWRSQIATRVKNLRSGLPFVSLHYRTSNRLRPLSLSSVYSQSLACSAPVGSAKSIGARLEARSSSAQKAHIDISRSVPVGVPKRGPATIIGQPTPTKFPLKNGPEIVNFRPVL